MWKRGMVLGLVIISFMNMGCLLSDSSTENSKEDIYLIEVSDPSEDEIVLDEGNFSWVGLPVGPNAHNYTIAPPGKLDFFINETKSTLDILGVKYQHSSKQSSISFTVKGNKFPVHNDVYIHLYIEYANYSEIYRINGTRNQNGMMMICYKRINVSADVPWIEAYYPNTTTIYGGFLSNDQTLSINLTNTEKAKYFCGFIRNGEGGWWYADYFQSNRTS
ncbi:MAG: hypothetical protein QW728_04585 [Thermoplasmata archaeon]